MTSVNPSAPIPREYELQIRVRYQETDAQARVHHSNYINYFEVARVEMLRTSGRTYRDLESSGIMLVVTEVNCHYHRAAKYDDLLTIKIRVAYAKGVRIRHDYQVLLEEEIIAEGHTVVAAVDPTGKVVRLPKWLRLDKASQT